MATISNQIANSSRVEELIADTLRRIRYAIIENMDTHGRNASKQSINSLRIETNSVEGSLWGNKNFAFMEIGRGSGKVPFRFQDIIAQWIIDKGISVSSRRKLKSMAWVIAHNIRDKGTALHRSGKKDDIFSTAMDKETQILGDKILYLVDSDITYIAKRFANPTNN